MQLHQAEKELQACETEKDKMQALAELTRKLPAVWTLQSMYQRMEDARTQIVETKKEQHRLQAALPKYLEQEQAAAGAEKLQKEQLDIWNEKLGQTAAQVEKAQELFERIAREKQKQAERKQVLEKAEQGKKERRMHSFSKKNRPDCGKHRWRRFRLWISVRHSGNKSIPRRRSCLGTGESLERCETRCGFFRNPEWSCRSVMQRFGRSIRLSMRTVSRYGRLFWMHRQAFWHSSWSKESPVRSVVRKSSGSVSDSAGFAHPVAGCS